MNIYCIRHKDDFLAVADFDKALNSGEFDLSPSNYILSGMITEDEEETINREIVDGLYRRLDRWIQEKRYLPRLVLSSLVFLLCYLFCSLVVRDPIALIDELIISSAASVFAWIIISRKDLKAKCVLDAKEKWQKNIDDADFVYKSYIGELEFYFDEISSIGFKDLIKRIANRDLPPFDSECNLAFKQSLESYLNSSKKLESNYIKEIRRGKTKERRLEKHLLSDYFSGNLDIYLLAFCLGVMHF